MKLPEADGGLKVQESWTLGAALRRLLRNFAVRAYIAAGDTAEHEGFSGPPRGSLGIRVGA